MRKVILSALLLCVFIGVSCAWSSSLGDWDYRQLHNITGNATWETQSNYQIKFVVNTGVGTSTDGTVYLNNHGQSDIGDIRFGSLDETTVYDYWIESTDNPYTVWVEIPTLTNGTNQVYVYYGNAIATDLSNGDNTFDFFDHFDGTSLNAEKWSIISGATGISLYNSILVLNYNVASTNVRISSKTAFDKNIISEMNGTISHAGTPSFGFYLPTTPITHALVEYNYPLGGKLGTRTKNPSVSESNTDMGSFTTGYNIFSVIVNGTTSAKYRINETLVAEDTIDVSGGNKFYWMRADFTNAVITAEYIRVRKYLNQEPTHTTWYSEENNTEAPIADFTTVETCGNVGDTFYFIDFSTGGGLYSWEWDFGDGSCSEMRNPTHQYASNGTYDVNLSVWGAYGFDSLLRENLITIPCGAATPTLTPTVTPTGTPGNVTEGNATYIYAPDQDYVPFPIWLAIVIVSIALFGHSIIFLKNSDLTAIMAALYAMVSAWLSNMIGYIDVQVTSFAEEIVISPVIQAVHPPWLVYTMLIFVFVSVVNIFAAIYKVYIKPVPWNEIYDRKLPKWERRK